MNKHLATALLATLIATAPPLASAQNVGAPTTAQPEPGWSTLRTYAGTIVRVDAGARTVTTRNAAGEIAIFEAPPSLPSSQLAGFTSGENVVVTFYDGFEARRRTAGGTPVATSVDPGTGQRTATVTVTAVDATARTITFIGPRGRYTRGAGDATDTNLLKTLTIGERVDLTYFEYVQSMTRSASTSGAVTSALPAAPTTAPGESLRDRMTFHTLYGVDNQFSGKMIEAANGRTTTGVPINLEETTYDEVYGRMGLLKVGVGYRMTPRIEGVANFVYSSSSPSFEAVQIGTAGTTTQLPLQVNFTKYAYWGVEVGQRFSFASGRLTPYAGWLVGLNRNQDIRGTFVGVPQNVTPGLAAQDGKFFERSWAFSLGPTGGVLINAGPLDVIAETQLRFLGGLSDVDWLVEEGLRDVNSESERWSIPFLAGVRLRF